MADRADEPTSLHRAMASCADLARRCRPGRAAAPPGGYGGGLARAAAAAAIRRQCAAGALAAARAALPPFRGTYSVALPLTWGSEYVAVSDAGRAGTATDTEAEAMEVTLADSIRAFARRVGVGEPPPAADPDAVQALVCAHDSLVCGGFAEEAAGLVETALAFPAFAGLCRRADLFAGGRPLGAATLAALVSEEAWAAVEGRAAAPGAAYVFTLGEVLALGVAHAPRSAAHAAARLDAFVGGYLADLDLGRTMVTGSAVAAALIVTRVESTFAGHAEYLAVHYPAARTTPRDYRAYDTLVGAARRAGPGGLSFRAERDGGGFALTVALAGHEAVLDVEPGADVDMAIDVDTAEEFDRVARAHYGVIRARHPTAALARDQRGACHAWVVRETDPARLGTFRQVEMYRATFATVASHHVGMTAGAYTARFSGGAPEFVVTARLVYSMAHLRPPNYYAFTSTKQTPQAVILKYKARGFDLPRNCEHWLDPVLNFVLGYHDARRDLPALHGVEPFSAYALPVELQRLGLFTPSDWGCRAPTKMRSP